MPKQESQKLKIKIMNLNKRLSSTLTSFTSFKSRDSLSSNPGPYSSEKMLIECKGSTVDLLEIKNPTINLNLKINTTKSENQQESLEDIHEIINITIPINTNHHTIINTIPDSSSRDSDRFCPILEAKSSSKRILRNRIVSIPPELATIFEDRLREEEALASHQCFVEIKLMNRFSTFHYHSIDEPSKRRKGLYRPGLDSIQLHGTPSKPYPHLTGFLNTKKRYHSSPYNFKYLSRYST